MPMGSLFRRPPAPMLGIDISASSIKLVELGQDKSGAWVLERCAMEPLEKGWVADGNIEKFDEVADALRRVVKKSGTKAKQVALALPHTAVITKRIVLPASLGEQELELHVESEASQYSHHKHFRQNTQGGYGNACIDRRHCFGFEQK